MNEAVIKYLSAYKTFEQADNELWRVQKMIGIASSGLAQRPPRFHFGNTSVKLPPEVTKNHSTQTLDARLWPASDEIQEAIAHWHQADQALRAAWESVAKGDRGPLQPPKPL